MRFFWGKKFRRYILPSFTYRKIIGHDVDVASSLPVGQRAPGGVRRRRRCCFARMHASAIVHHHRWDAMRCHAMHARLRSCVFSRLSSSRTHRDRPRQRHPASSSQPHMHCAHLSRPCVPERVYSVHSRPQRPMLYTQSWGPHACIPRLGSS
jgi:hypothetical protein